jgi:alkylhydroperoxidase family enzyme
MRVTVTHEQIRTAFEAVKDDPSFDQSRGLWERGKPPVEMIQAMALRPDILRAFAGLGEALYPGGLLERRVQELVIITASQRSECQFCENAHVDMVDIEGIIDDPLSHIADPGPLPARERLAVLYTQAVVADSNNLPDGLMTEIHANFSDPELVELTFLVGYINLLNLFNNSLGVRYRGDYRALLDPVAGG